MIKIDELTHNFINGFCDFEQQTILTNYFHGDWEADIFIIDKDGKSHEIEVKYSRTDFKNDFKKSYTDFSTGKKFLKHDKISSGDYVCNRFSFLLPQGLIKHEEIPMHCGIIEFYHDEDRWETAFRFLREPREIHAQNYWDLVDKDMMLRKMSLNLLQRKFQLKAREEELIFKNPYGGISF